MLSIGKLGTGQARYYLDQAHGRVDVVQSVAGGAEDYYTRSGEACGVWMGRGASELGLVGEVGEEQLRPLLEGSTRVRARCCGVRRARSVPPRSI